MSPKSRRITSLLLRSGQAGTGKGRSQGGPSKTAHLGAAELLRTGTGRSRLEAALELLPTAEQRHREDRLLVRARAHTHTDVYLPS